MKKKIDVLLVNPPRQQNGNFSLFNNSLLWIASFLEKNGISCQVIFLKNNFEKQLLQSLLNYKPNFVGVSMKWWDTIYSAELIAKRVKAFNSNIFVFAGGQTATYYAQEVLENSVFDAVIEGDAEIPLLNLIKNQSLCNLKIKENNEIITYPKSYIQDNEALKDLSLVENIESIFEDLELVSNYIWTGKGCAMNCFFCGGGRDGQKDIFSRKGYLYRPIEQVIKDIEIIAKLKNNTFMLDFDPLAPNKENFYRELFLSLPKKKYNCQFYFWTLPSDEFIDLMSETFNKLIFDFDLQIFSEPLRKKLAKVNFIKPIFFTNEYFESIIAKCEKKGNILVNVSGLLGVPQETKQDILEIYNFANKLMNNFKNVIGFFFSPIILEPASPLLAYPEKYQVTCLRKDYFDFKKYTKKVFENNMLEKEFQTYEQYLDYTGLLRDGYNEEETFNECFNIQVEITEKAYSRAKSLGVRL